MIAGIVVGVLAGIIIFGLMLPSIRLIGATEVGLVKKRFGKPLPEDNPVAFKGEAGYQADMLMPGVRFKFWILYSVENHPWVQIPAGEIGIVFAQVGKPTPMGAKSAHYKKEFGIFHDIRSFVEKDGQKGVQRPVLTTGTIAPYHPVGFIVLTKNRLYGKPVAHAVIELAKQLSEKDFNVLVIRSAQEISATSRTLRQPDKTKGGTTGEAHEASIVSGPYNTKVRDEIGVITTLEGEPLQPGYIASRLGGFDDVEKAEKADMPDREIMEIVLGSKNQQHNNYQDYQAFLENGGKMGLQHDPLLYGAYTLNPFLVKVEIAPMLVVEQGEVAVIKSYVGLPSEPVAGEEFKEFKFGTLVKPGHRGIWIEPLRTGKYPINPHCYEAEIVPTAILTLNWAEVTSAAHRLDTGLTSIEAKSREGFIFKIDLQVQIHVAALEAPKVISMVGTMENLVTEVLQAAVGNHFRDKLQSMPAVVFIETRQQVQEQAYLHVEKQLRQYRVETRGVYIQNVVLPPQLVEVLTAREIANQQIATFKKEKEAQDQRIEKEKAFGLADMQKQLAKEEVTVKMQEYYKEQQIRKADGDAYYTRETGKAEGEKEAAIGTGKARGYEAQVKAIGAEGTTLVNALKPISEGKIAIVPQVVVGSGDSLSGLAGVLMRKFITPPEQAGEKKER